MKPFLSSLVVLCILVAAYLLADLLNISIPNNLATALQSQNKALTACIKSFSDEPLKSFTLTQADFNSDGEGDTLVQFNSETGCGNAGCIHEICMYKNPTEHVHIPFGYAARTIDVDDTMTNGMKDLIVNEDESLKLSWDGSIYTLNTDNSF